MHVRAVNFIAPAEPFRHHEVFFAFAPVPAEAGRSADAAFVVDFLGMRTRRETFCIVNILSQSVAHAARAQACMPRPWDLAEPPSAPAVSFPIVSEASTLTRLSRV